MLTRHDILIMQQKGVAVEKGVVDVPPMVVETQPSAGDIARCNIRDLTTRLDSAGAAGTVVAAGRAVVEADTDALVPSAVSQDVVMDMAYESSSTLLQHDQQITHHDAFKFASNLDEQRAMALDLSWKDRVWAAVSSAGSAGAASGGPAAKRSRIAEGSAGSTGTAQEVALQAT